MRIIFFIQTRRLNTYCKSDLEIIFLFWSLFRNHDKNIIIRVIFFFVLSQNLVKIKLTKDLTNAIMIIIIKLVFIITPGSQFNTHTGYIQKVILHTIFHQIKNRFSRMSRTVINIVSADILARLFICQVYRVEKKNDIFDFSVYALLLKTHGRQYSMIYFCACVTHYIHGRCDKHRVLVHRVPQHCFTMSWFNPVPRINSNFSHVQLKTLI